MLTFAMTVFPGENRVESMAYQGNKALHSYNFLHFKSYMHSASGRSRNAIWGEVFEGQMISQLGKEHFQGSGKNKQR